MTNVYQVWDKNYQVYGARKVWRQMNREGKTMARCTVERLMRKLGIQGVRRGKRVRTTAPGKAVPCPRAVVRRNCTAERPNQLWWAYFTYVSTWQGWLYVAFVVDAYARRIVGWRTGQGLSKLEALRCLKRYIAREVFYVLRSRNQSTLTLPRWPSTMAYKIGNGCKSVLRSCDAIASRIVA